jgi:hypothetical protein
MLSQHIVVLKPARIAPSSVQEQERAPLPASQDLDVCPDQVNKFFTVVCHIFPPFLNTAYFLSRPLAGEGTFSESFRIALSGYFTNTAHTRL